MEKDAYYFPHFSNARSDRKLKRVIKELGVEGYGIYFMILEVLRDQSDFKYPLEDIDLLADEFNTSEQKVRTVVSNYKLFDVDEEQMFFSTKFNEFMQPYLSMKEQRRLAGIASGKARRAKALALAEQAELNDRSTDVQRMVNENEQSKVKESKVNKFSEDSLEYRLSKYLYGFLLERNPNHKEPNFQTWASHIDLMIRKDNREPKQIGEVIKWAQEDSFWCTNILSTSKLRKQYDTILIKMGSSKKPKKKLNIVQSDLTEYNA